MFLGHILPYAVSAQVGKEWFSTFLLFFWFDSSLLHHIPLDNIGAPYKRGW